MSECKRLDWFRHWAKWDGQKDSKGIFELIKQDILLENACKSWEKDDIIKRLSSKEIREGQKILEKELPERVPKNEDIEVSVKRDKNDVYVEFKYIDGHTAMYDLYRGSVWRIKSICSYINSVEYYFN